MDSSNFPKLKKLEKAIPITRLTSIKSLCLDEVAAAKFALFNISCQGDYTNTTSQERAIAPRETATKLHSKKCSVRG